MRERPLVYLVGAGPGDPELLTLKAWRLLRRADVVVHDRLVSDGVLALIRPDACRIDVGKRAGAHRLGQQEINALLVGLAAPGRTVVRLKGGDPLIFGRGGEEALSLLAHGIDVEIVPGITAAFGAAAALKVPLTHRGVATGVRFVTGHCRDGWWLDLDWRGLADPQTTLVLYMGLAHIEPIAAQLVAAGLDTDTPVLAVERATLADERSVRATLGTIGAAVRAERFAPPVLFVIGAVVDVLAAVAPAEPPARTFEGAMHA
jgi:uroporphyrin-III C-methyltransferase